MRQFTTGILAMIIVYVILRQTELYIPRILDDDWSETRNDPLRKADPFNVCSPESFDDCKRSEAKYLSRY